MHMIAIGDVLPGFIMYGETAGFSIRGDKKKSY